METAVTFVGWLVVIGVAVLGAAWVWYYAIYWLLKAFGANATTTKLVRIYAASLYRERQRQKQKALNTLMSHTRQVGGGETAVFEQQTKAAEWTKIK